MPSITNWLALAALAAHCGAAALVPSGVTGAEAIASEAIGGEASESSPAGEQSRPPLEVATIDEMLLDPSGRRERWTSAPGLVVLTSVMAYQPGASETYVATSEPLDTADTDSLVADLMFGLRRLTNDTFVQFASIQYESPHPGASVAIVRPNQIVVGRFQGVRELAHTIGFGGRKARRDGSIVGGTIVLDSVFDRTNPRRRLLRTHELGHALGYNHVHSRISIMNPKVGPEVNDVDRQIAELAFSLPSLDK